MNTRAIRILLVEDEPIDCVLIRRALEKNHVPAEVQSVADGQQLMDYLRRRGPYAALARQPLPGLILLDLNMPNQDGREALREIKSDPALRRIPVVVLTQSKAEEDVLHTYDWGVNSFILKPVTFPTLVEVLATVAQYWFEIVELPPAEAFKTT